MIVLNNVSFEYSNNDRKAGVYNINLHIPTGQVVLLCGPSGCGKTTLTRLINGLSPSYYRGPLKGQILINGEERGNEDIYELSSKIGSLFQNPRIQFFNVDSTDEIAFGCENLGIEGGEILGRIGRVTRDFSIEYLLDKNIFTLSGGEKQKIACASLAAMEPDIFILDEPSSNLDLSTVEDLKEIIKKWKKKRKTVIIAEHRLYYLMDVADRVIYMNEGRVELDIPAAEFEMMDVEKLHRMGLRSQRAVRFVPGTQKLSQRDTFYFSDLSFSYGRRSFLNIPEVEIPYGTVVGVLGYNGAGKSTFAKAVCGCEREARGILYYKGKRLGLRQRRKISYMVMQDVNHQLFTESVLEEIILSMEEDMEDARLRGEVILHELSLDMFQNVHPMALSGGQKQRVALGSALASERELLILDEPTGGLDYMHMLEVAKILKRLSWEGRTVFLITQDPELLQECCDYLLFLDDGKLLWSGEWTVENTKKVNEFFLRQ